MEYYAMMIKLNDRCNILLYDSAYPKSLKDSILFSQALRIKQICSETKVIRHFKTLEYASIKRNYKPELLDYQFESNACRSKSTFTNQASYPGKFTAGGNF